MLEYEKQLEALKDPESKLSLNGISSVISSWTLINRRKLFMTEKY